MAALSVDGMRGVQGAALLLNHDLATVRNGVTKQYIGPSFVSTWEQRMRIPEDAEWGLNPEFQGKSRKRKRIEVEEEDSRDGAS
jgi:hypothetical protein